MKLTNFALGIRFVKGFHVEDQLGAIVDDILYSEGSNFNETLFPELQRSNGSRRLINKNKECQLTISPTDFIFEYRIQENFKNELDLYLSEFNNRIIGQIFKSYKIKNIIRIGFVIGATLSQNDELLDAVSSAVKKHYDLLSNNSLSLRFNVIHKTPLKIGKEITQDSDNTIITYDKSQDGENFTFSVDYQKFYSPVLEFMSDSPVSFTDFCYNCYKKYIQKYAQKETK